MRKFALGFLMLFALSLAACGGSSTATGDTGNTPAAPTDTTAPAPAATATPAPSGGGAATVTMGSFSFASGTSVSIKAGQSVTFNDPSDTGGTHILVIGKNGQFAAKSGAPSEFNSASGTMFNPGDTKTVTFATAGTYTLTCTIHPSMLATIAVS